MTRRQFLGTSTLACAGLVVACETLSRSQSSKPAPNPPRNVRVSQAPAAGYVECSIAVNPRNPRNLLATSMMFSAAGAAPAPPRIATFASLDGGKTWSEGGILALPAGTNHSNDPTVAFDVRGRGFVAATATVQSEQGISSTDRGVYVWRSDDAGRTFGAPVAVVRGQFADHPWIAGGMAGDERLYVTWRTRDPGGLLFSRSTDGGLTFEPPRRIIPGSTLTAIDRVAVGLGGSVHAAYVAPTGRAENHLQLVSSKDHGDTFASPASFGPVQLSLELPGGTRIENGPGLAAGPIDGSVFVAYSPLKPESAAAAMVVARSSDGGVTWGPAVPVGRAADNSALLQPEVVVTAAGAVLVTYLALARDRVEVRLVSSTNSGARFGSPRTITGQSFDPRLSNVAEVSKHGSWFLGDYQGLAAGANAVHALWADTRTGRADLFTASVPVP